MFYNKITNVKNMGSYFIEFAHPVAQEKDGEHGLSHLVEHCMCERIKELDRKFHENGIAWNAYTSTSKVVFYINGLTKALKKFIPDYTDKVLNYQITKEVFEREKKVVISEYLMYYNESIERFTNNWSRRHYNYTSELGLLSDLQNITYEKFMEFKNRVFNKPTNIFYIHPKNSADLKLPELEKIEYNTVKPIIKYDKFGEYTNYPEEYYSTGIDTQRILMFGIDYKFNKENFARVNALSSLFNYFMDGGLTSYLYQEIREKYACVYAISSCGICFDSKDDIFTGFLCGTDEKNVKLLTKVIHRCMKKLIKHITKRKFNSIYKTMSTKYKIQEMTCFDSYSFFCDPDIRKTMDIIINKEITFEEFIEFAQNFVDKYTLYNDTDYLPQDILQSSKTK